MASSVWLTLHFSANANATKVATASARSMGTVSVKSRRVLNTIPDKLALPWRCTENKQEDLSLAVQE